MFVKVFATFDGARLPTLFLTLSYRDFTENPHLNRNHRR